MKHVVIFQRRLVHYRIEFFTRLKHALAIKDVHLDLVIGQPDEDVLVKKDGGNLEWATQVKNFEVKFFGKTLVWQAFPSQLKSCDIAIVTQENKILSNYALQLASIFGRRKIAFWGHGKNFQSNSADGLAEQWKRFWLCKVNWWFAYTELSKRAVLSAQFDPRKITVLNNSLDSTELQLGIERVSELELGEYLSVNGVVGGAKIGLYCGSLYNEKKIDFLIEAAVQLRRSLPDFHLFVLGAGPEAAKVQYAASKHSWIHYKGMQKGQEKAVAFKAASFLMNPGAVGLSVIDSFATARPLVTLRCALHGPEIEYLLNGQNAVVVDVDSIEAYVGAIVDMLSNNQLLATMHNNCRAASLVYSLDAMVEKFSAGIVDALNSK